MNIMNIKRNVDILGCKPVWTNRSRSSVVAVGFAIAMVQMLTVGPLFAEDQPNECKLGGAFGKACIDSGECGDIYGDTENADTCVDGTCQVPCEDWDGNPDHSACTMGKRAFKASEITAPLTIANAPVSKWTSTSWTPASPCFWRESPSISLRRTPVPSSGIWTSCWTKTTTVHWMCSTWTCA